jgi:hypothetical protein
LITVLKRLVFFSALLLIAVIMSGCRDQQKTEFDSSIVVQVPAGYVDYVDPVKASSSVIIKFWGWAADIQGGTTVKELVVLVDGKQIPVAYQMAVSRPDVAEVYKCAAFEKSGWSSSIPASSLGKGKHKIEFYAVLSDKTLAALRCSARFCNVEVVE